MRSNRYAKTLEQAAEAVGGNAKLAHFLMVPQRKLERWIAGRESAPLDAFLSALDIIADGPFATEQAEQKRRVRVAVLPGAPVRS